MFNKKLAICLLVDDFEKSLSFYKDTLGLGVNSQEGEFANFKPKSILMFLKGNIKPEGSNLIGFSEIPNK